MNTEISGSSEVALSVILPAYNAGDHLIPAVQSILNQTFVDFELLILDDGSTDGSINAVRKLNDKRVKIISDGKNRGLAIRLNQGIQQANGTYIARMDADDLCFPNRFETQIAYLEGHSEIDLLATRIVVFKPNNRILGLLPFRADHVAICARPWLTIPMPHATWMARRTWYLKHLYKIPECLRAEDQELLLRAMADSQFACLADVTYAYRQGEFNLRKTLKARRSQLMAQLDYARTHGAVTMAILSIIAFLAKSAIDVGAALPGNDKLFFRRMAQPISTDILEKTRALLAS